jgi:transposase InsO family protein
LARDFAADYANQKWVGDILGIRTDEGWLYLAALLDIFSRMIVGWAMSIYRDEQLVEDALSMAIQQRCIGLDSDLLHHSDRGSQYTANDYQNLLTLYGVEVSMSRKGDPYDNVMMESFFSTLRAELTELEHFETINQARLAVFDYLEVFYNRQRIHSSIHYMTPLEYETFHLL